LAFDAVADAPIAAGTDAPSATGPLPSNGKYAISELRPGAFAVSSRRNREHLRRRRPARRRRPVRRSRPHAVTASTARLHGSADLAVSGSL
jgi:hypothetical protein